MSSLREIIVSVTSLVITLGGTYFVARSFGGLFAGAPFVPIRRSDVEDGMALAKIQPNETVTDLGCGDGRVLVAALERGATAIGYEISPIFCFISWLRVRRFGARAAIYRKNFFKEDLSRFDVIFAFQLTRIMTRLSDQLLKQTKPDVRIVSYVFSLPESDWRLVEERRLAKLYVKKAR